MKTSTYPTIGQKLSFIRQNLNNKENPIHQGVGIVCALSMDTHKRLVATMLTMKDNGSGESEKVNVDLQCLNPSEEFVANFAATTQAVQNLQSEGNGKAAEVVAEYNQLIQSAYSGVLGEPVEVEAL